MLFSKITEKIIECQTNNNRCEIRALLSGKIIKIFYRDESFVKKDKPILIYEKNSIECLVTAKRTGYIYYTVKTDDIIKKNDLIAIIYKNP